MKVKEKLMLDRAGLCQHGPVNIVILGDSVSHGAICGYMDYESVYYNRLRKMLNAWRDYVPVNMINAAIGGTSAADALLRLDSQVFCHAPDLIIVCFGLNDVNGSLDTYLNSLRAIFRRSAERGFDVIFMTPNMLNTYPSDEAPPQYREYAVKTADMQNSGRMDEYMAAAVALATEEGVPVCDCYAKWKELSKTQDVTALLANRINHPLPEMHHLFADALYAMIMGEEQNAQADESTMFRA